MPRSGENARRRLQQAARELYHQAGYDNTTTAQIADRAGVTERTFFRHFADTREVLFDGEATLRADLETRCRRSTRWPRPSERAVECLSHRDTTA